MALRIEGRSTSDDGVISKLPRALEMAVEEAGAQLGRRLHSAETSHKVSRRNLGELTLFDLSSRIKMGGTTRETSSTWCRDPSSGDALIFMEAVEVFQLDSGPSHLRPLQFSPGVLTRALETVKAYRRLLRTS